mmetsp:Transcript_113793/g.332396  ORF Transcript_113793/g.332396 Transcript_113793/m.332396 type:complete len:81 (-) Transcript_113793:7-249(-)
MWAISVQTKFLTLQPFLTGPFSVYLILKSLMGFTLPSDELFAALEGERVILVASLAGVDTLQQRAEPAPIPPGPSVPTTS